MANRSIRVGLPSCKQSSKERCCHAPQRDDLLFLLKNRSPAKDSQLDGNTQLINSSIRDRMVGPDFFQNRSRPSRVNLVQDVFTVFPKKARDESSINGMVVRRKRCLMILPGVGVSWSESATIGWLPGMTSVISFHPAEEMVLVTFW